MRWSVADDSAKKKKECHILCLLRLKSQNFTCLAVEVLPVSQQEVSLLDHEVESRRQRTWVLSTTDLRYRCL